MKVFITGGEGKLGTELVRIYPDSIHPSEADMDITDARLVDSYIGKVKPDLLIHTAAMTSIRICETDRETALQVNVDGTRNIVNAVREHCPDCYFIHISTACVFPGDRGDYTEEDIPYPKNFYSLTKLLSEFVLRESPLGRKLVIRTNFAAREKWPFPRAFTDRFGTYLFGDDLARAIGDVVDRELLGTVHVCGADRLSMYELARITTPDVQPMTLAEYSGPPLTVDMTLRSVRIDPFEISR